LAVDSQVIAFAPFSQNSKDEVCLGSGQAQPGQSKPSGWLAHPQGQVGALPSGGGDRAGLRGLHEHSLVDGSGAGARCCDALLAAWFQPRGNMFHL
jgi:hypothetical protein